MTQHVLPLFLLEYLKDDILTQHDKILSIAFLFYKHFRILLILHLAEKVCIKSTSVAWAVYCGKERH